MATKIKLFLWPRWDIKSPIVFAVAETVEQARQLIMDEYTQLKQEASEQDYYNPDDLVGIGILNAFEPEVFDVPAGFFLVM